jgi:hypothetical protein
VKPPHCSHACLQALKGASNRNTPKVHRSKPSVRKAAKPRGSTASAMSIHLFAADSRPQRRGQVLLLMPKGSSGEEPSDAAVQRIHSDGSESSPLHLIRLSGQWIRRWGCGVGESGGSGLSCLCTSLPTKLVRSLLYLACKDKAFASIGDDTEPLGISAYLVPCLTSALM